MPKTITIHEALRVFAEAVADKMSQLTPGEPEDQLRGPFENFMADVARALGWNVVCTGETPLPDRPHAVAADRCHGWKDMGYCLNPCVP